MIRLWSASDDDDEWLTIAVREVEGTPQRRGLLCPHELLSANSCKIAILVEDELEAYESQYCDNVTSKASSREFQESLRNSVPESSETPRYEEYVISFMSVLTVTGFALGCLNVAYLHVQVVTESKSTTYEIWWIPHKNIVVNSQNTEDPQESGQHQAKVIH